MLPDTRDALRLEARHATPDAILHEAESRPAAHERLFAYYVVHRVGEAALASPDVLSRLLRLIEDPRTNPWARETYYFELPRTVETPDPSPGRQALDWALLRTAIRLVAARTPYVAGTPYLAGTLATNHIPNRIWHHGVAGSRLDARAVFSTNPAEIVSLARALDRQIAETGAGDRLQPPKAALRRLLEWLEEADKPLK
jgi:hypothetical protein